VDKNLALPTHDGAQVAVSHGTSVDPRLGSVARKAASILALLLLLLACASAWGQGRAVTTYHSDGARTGQSTDATILVPSNVNSTKFGKLFSYAVDGIVVAQPLYVPNVTLPGIGTRNVVYVVTQHDSVYAFDADNFGTGAPLWQVNFLNAAAGISSVPISEQLCNGTGFSEIGIMGTPAIDTTTGTLYLSAKTRLAPGSPSNSGTAPVYQHTLHALDITTGADRVTPVVVDASVVNAVGNTVYFHTNNLLQCQRPALLLSNGTVFVAYGSNGCDLHSYGWVMAYSASTLQQLAVFNTAPTPAPNLATGASLWMSGGGIAQDENGSLYISTANGPFDAITNWGDTVLKLGFSNNNSISVADYFTPFDQDNMAKKDLDLGSGGVTILPDQSGLNPHLMVTSGKTGSIYLLNRDNMGQYNPTNNPPLNDNSQIVQYIPAALGLFDSVPVYWNNKVYFAAFNDSIKAFALVNGQFSPTTPVAQSLKYAQVGVPVISSSETTGGIVWNIHNPVSPVLSALDAGTLAELYNSGQKGTRDTLGQVAHFATPAIANNKVFVGSTSSLSVYGVFPFLALLGGNAQSAAAGTTLTAPLTVQAVDSQGNGDPGVSVTFSDNGAKGTFNPATAITDSTGTATTMYTVPTRAGSIGITASSSSTAPVYRNVLLSAQAIPGPAAVIGKTSGVGQYGTVGTTLAAPLVVALRDAYGNGVVGQQITFTDGGAGGTFSANKVTTGAAGVASVSYTLPKKAQYIVLTATFGSISAGSAEHAVAGPATAVNINSGNNQSVKVGTVLKLLSLIVTDQYGNAVSGATITFSDGGVGGSFSSKTATTNLGGTANTTYTAPSTPQVVHISATVSGLTPAIFTETVHP
jgi:hypothetical protein